MIKQEISVPDLSLTRTGQVYKEELIFERSRPGRKAYSLPGIPEGLKHEIPSSFLNPEDLKLPEVSEPDVVRHYTRLSTWNYGIDTNLYPLGSCTMKYNPRINEEVAGLRQLSELHPDTPAAYAQHALKLLFEAQEAFKVITDMDGCTLQPAAGAHGELTGLFLIHAYHLKKGENRPVVLVPDSAHGTNPATCTLAGFEIRQIRSLADGTLDIEDLKSKISPDVAGLMITNPNTVGIFEKEIVQICELMHSNGSLVYMDGANFNAITGKVSLKQMGIDVCHLNLHKTFSTPHGGGGPGAAAVVVNEKLVSFLPGPLAAKGTENGKDFYYWQKPADSIGRVKSGPGHFGIVLRAYSYVLTYGKDLHLIAENSVLNAVIVRKALEDTFSLAGGGDTMHEAVFSDATLKKAGGNTLDLAKTLIDYGYHPPTVFFPLIVSGAMMIEPTETESPETILHFTEVMKDIFRRFQENPETLKSSPQRAFAGRPDEVLAARQPVLNYFTE